MTRFAFGAKCGGRTPMRTGGFRSHALRRSENAGNSDRAHPHPAAAKKVAASEVGKRGIG